MTLRVIGAGFGRTGTDAMREALNILGFGPCQAAVMAEVPPDRLILHRLDDGWGPLCAGLGVPVPDVRWPRTNSTAEIRQRFATE